MKNELIRKITEVTDKILKICKLYGRGHMPLDHRPMTYLVTHMSASKTMIARTHLPLPDDSISDIASTILGNYVCN